MYLDNGATTKVLPEVSDVMLEMLTNCYGNPSSLHKKGFYAEQAVNVAHKTLCDALDCREDEFFFTNGGTHSNSLAVLGTARAYKRRGNKVIIGGGEHSSVINCGKQLEKEGFVVVYLPLLSDGTVDLQSLESQVDDSTILVSTMLVNSEVGSINNISSIVNIVKRKNLDTIVHSDCVQAFGKLPVTPNKWKVDLVSISAHKIHGPKGCGGLYRKKGVRSLPLTFGVGKENSLNPGTQNTAGICGFGVAAKTMIGDMKAHNEKFLQLSEYFLNVAKKREYLCINSPINHAPYIMSISVLGFRSEILIHYLEEEEIYVSSGSACSKGAKSHVLTAMGLGDKQIDGTLRISFSKDSTTEEVDALFNRLDTAVQVLAKGK